IVVGSYAWWLGWVQKNELARIARLLESRDPALGSRLINLLQLQDQTSDPKVPALTQQLAAQAVAGYAKELGPVDFDRLARTGRWKKSLRKAAWFGCGFAVLLAAFYPVTMVELARFFDPYGDHPPYSFTRLEIVDPGEDTPKVIYKGKFLVKAKHAGHRPDDLYITYHPPGKPEQAITVPMIDKGSQGFQQQIENIQTDLEVFAHTKKQSSYSRRRQIAVLLTPKLEQAFSKVAPPAYTGLKPDEKTFQFKNLRALKGSEVSFRLRSNRPLRDGIVEVIKGEKDVQRVTMTRNAENEVTGTIPAADSCRLRFHLVDVGGIPSEDIWEGSLTVTHDLAPQVRITQPSKDSFVAMDFKVDAGIEADDDYGIKHIRLHRALNQVYSPPKIYSYAEVTKNAREMFLFNFMELGVKPGDTVSFFAEAVDTAPEPNLARSEIINLFIISVEDYNQHLRQQHDLSDIEAKYTALLAQLEEQIQDQKKLNEEVAAIQKELATAPAAKRDELQSKLDSALARQNEINQKLDKLAGQMENFVRKDPVYDVEAELQERLAARARQIRESTAANQQAAQSVSSQSTSPDGKRQVSEEMLAELKKAGEEQVKRLENIERRAEQEVSEVLQDMSKLQEIMKDLNRFEQLFQAQEALAEQARAYNREGSLGREDQLALKQMAATERDVAEALKRLEEKLREDSKAAEELFPKAAKSAKDLADKMESARLNSLGRQATDRMLAGAGDQSFQLADRLREEMGKMFGECKGGEGEMSNELDQYMKLTRSMNPGRNFKQMMMSQKFGKGKGKDGQGFGMGMTGMSGESGYAVTTAPTMNVMGSEASLTQGSKAEAQPGAPGVGPGGGAPDGNGLKFDKPDVVKGLNAINRESGAVSGEPIIEEYNDIVEKYFKAITK
ncbi:MAG: hypothetical protein K0Q55_3871, partial [Verrucomicrobia bacterium]|nr:hypothetical protein [Verrucomicrobiota bacterium]